MRKGECEACGQKALLLEKYGRGPFRTTTDPIELCDSCSEFTEGGVLTEGLRDKLLLAINHKLDRLLSRSS